MSLREVEALCNSVGTNIWLLGWCHKTRLRFVTPGSMVPASIPCRIIALFKPAFPTPFSATWTDCCSRNRLLRHRWMWVSFAAWALGSGEQSKRMLVPQANVASGAGCPGWWACVPARQPASPTPSPSSPCCSCWALLCGWVPQAKRVWGSSHLASKGYGAGYGV